MNPAFIRCPLAARSKEEALAELARLVGAAGVGISEIEIYETLQSRERQGPFSMSKGVAYPHARTDRIDDFIIAVGTCPTGIDFKAPDGFPVRLVVLFLVPKKHSNLYLHTLALFLNAFSNEKRAVEVSGASSPADLISRFDTLNGNSKHESG